METIDVSGATVRTESLKETILFPMVAVINYHNLVAKTTQIYYMTVLEIRILKQVCRAVFLLEIPGKHPLPSLF